MHIVIGIVFNRRRDSVLLSKRLNNAHQGGLWEFPGGKRAGRERPEETLTRELKEEIDITVSDSSPLLKFEYDYPDRSLEIEARVVEHWSGTPVAREGQAIKWTAVEDLGEIDFPAANHKIIRALRLPEIYFITPDVQAYDQRFLDSIESILDAGIRLLRLRSNNLVGKDRYDIAVKLKHLCWKYNCWFLYDGTPEEVMELGADGLHLTSRTMKGLVERPLDQGYWIGASCHIGDELVKASAIKADFALLSPVKSTSSHPEMEPMGWEIFSRLAESIDIPVYALGGLRPEDLRQARCHHARGIAMISGLWNLNM